MNIKKKMSLLCMLLIVITILPLSLRAASKQDEDYIIEKTGYQFTLETAPDVKIELHDPIRYSGKDIVFYVSLENATWLSRIEREEDETGFKNAKITILEKNKIEVRLKDNQARGTYYIPLLTRLEGGLAKVKIDGNHTEISDMNFTTFAKAVDQSVAVTAGEVLKVKEEGYVADIVIEEAVLGSLTKDLDSKERTITLGLQNSDLEFATENITVQASKGFSGIKKLSARYAQDSRGNIDKGALEIVLPKLTDQTEKGKLTIKNIKVKGINPKKGSIDITVSSYGIGKATVKVGEIENYGITLGMKGEYSVPIVAGDKQKISFSIKESVPVSMVEGRTIDIRLENGYLSPYEDATYEDMLIGRVLLNGVNVKDELKIRTIKEDGFIVGFTFYIPKLNNKVANTITFEDVVIYAPVNATKDILLTAEGRDIEGTLSVVAAKVKQAAKVSVYPADLKLDEEKQKGGKIIIEETGRSMLVPGTIKVQLEDTKGIWFAAKPNVTVTKGDLKLGKVYYSSKDPRIIEIQVTASSKEASAIEINDFSISVDKTPADGSYKVTLYGSAFGIEGDFESSEGKDFIFIGRQNDIPTKPEPQPVKNIAKFMIGQTTYYINGIAKVMDAQPYVVEGRTMVPIKYVSEIAGVDAKNISYNKGVVTVIANNKVIQIEQGSNIAKVNGVSSTIDGKVILKDGRVYVPVSQIAWLLDIKVTWDGNTKTATFESK